MAVWGGYPQTVNYSTVNIAKGGGSENLLINPRGKVNQLNELQGVVAAGQYFCDGWKAGAAGAEIYVDADGFRLISGSIVQLVPNTIEAGRNLRSNMDVISGAPVMSINGGTSNEPNGAGAYIQLEISGDNSKFTRVILAESVELPIYQQSADEIEPCKKFLFIADKGDKAWVAVMTYRSTNYYWSEFMLQRKYESPAVSVVADKPVDTYLTDGTLVFSSTQAATIQKITVDARP